MQAEQNSSTGLEDGRVLRVTDLSVQFKGSERTVDAVKHLSFHVGRGETLAIVGESAQLRSVRGADMAMIFQEPMTSLDPIFTVGDQIAESLSLHQGMNDRHALAEALPWVG